MTDGSIDRYISRSKAGLKLEITTPSPFTLPEPAWVPDKDRPTCMSCHKPFSFTQRRHHCRRCGECFCDKCTNRKAFVYRLNFIDPVRVCTPCSSIAEKENRFFSTFSHTLIDGAELYFSQGDSGQLLCSCALTPSHVMLQLKPMDRSNVDWVPKQIKVSTISSLKITSSTTGADGVVLCTAVTISFGSGKAEPGARADAQRRLDISAFSTRPTLNDRGVTACKWLTALRFAMDMLLSAPNPTH